MVKEEKRAGKMNRRQFYMKWKRLSDTVLAALGLIILSPLFLLLIILIKLDSRGPVFFRQRRVGIHRKYFEILKFRTMRIDTPKDTPTHLLENPEQYITRMGKFLRKTSLDELPQLINILKGDMSIVGPRPALWNQEDLLKARERYGANDVMPGLTGWAQINGRDELEIPVKARLDGEYVKHMGIRMDCVCFLRTIASVLKSDGVVEGGTGKKKREGLKYREEEKNEKRTESRGKVEEKIRKGMESPDSEAGKNKEEKTRKSGCSYPAGEGGQGQKIEKKKILITGEGSFIGSSVEGYLKRNCFEEKYQVDTIDMRGNGWRSYDFTGYDTVFHVAGIAHADVGKVTEEGKKLYYQVNCDLAEEAARKAKDAGVGQFIFMSSMIVYEGCKTKLITARTKPRPANFYGDSKWQAEQRLWRLSEPDGSFKVAVLRPPMIYGPGSKGNYPVLARIAGALPLFPSVKNKRSMLYIDNLCQFVKLLIDNRESGVFFPQNSEYSSTSELVRIIARARNHRIFLVPFCGPAVTILRKFPGKAGKLAEKAFGDLAYDMEMSEYKENYRIYSLKESVWLTERS